TFDSTQALSTITLRETRNAEGEPVYTTIPVLDLNTPASGQSVVFPHIAAGGGFTTQFLLMNGGSQVMHRRINFVGSDGQPLSVRRDTATISNLQYDIPSQGAFRVEVAGFTTVTDGYAVLIPDAGTNTPAGTIIFRLSSGNNVVTEAGVAPG